MPAQGQNQSRDKGKGPAPSSFAPVALLGQPLASSFVGSNDLLAPAVNTADELDPLSGSGYGDADGEWEADDAEFGLPTSPLPLFPYIPTQEAIQSASSTAKPEPPGAARVAKKEARTTSGKAQVS